MRVMGIFLVALFSMGVPVVRILCNKNIQVVMTVFNFMTSNNRSNVQDFMKCSVIVLLLSFEGIFFFLVSLNIPLFFGRDHT